MINFKQSLKEITTFMFDVDGVLSSSIVVISEPYEMLRTANVKDGFALQLAVKKGYRVVIISGGKSETVRSRYELLGIKDIFMGVNEKLPVFEEYCRVNNLQYSEILYMGDDLPDLAIMQKVGVPCCPSDAAEEIKEISHYISEFKGGEGCVRDVLQQTLKIQGRWLEKHDLIW